MLTKVKPPPVILVFIALVLHILDVPGNAELVVFVTPGRIEIVALMSAIAHARTTSQGRGCAAVFRQRRITALCPALVLVNRIGLWRHTLNPSIQTPTEVREPPLHK
jgi:hypothetical protein